MMKSFLGAKIKFYKEVCNNLNTLLCVHVHTLLYLVLMRACAFCCTYTDLSWQSTDLESQWSWVRVPSEAAQFFSLSALDVNALPTLICLNCPTYTCTRFDHVHVLYVCTCTFSQVVAKCYRTHIVLTCAKLKT